RCVPRVFVGKILADGLQVGPSPRRAFYALLLESQTQTELNVATLFAAAGQRCLLGCDGRIRAGGQLRARIGAQVRGVGEVEEFRAELQVHAFARELDLLVQPEIEGKVPRSAE